MSSAEIMSWVPAFLSFQAIGAVIAFVVLFLFLATIRTVSPFAGAAFGLVAIFTIGLGVALDHYRSAEIVHGPGLGCETTRTR